MDTPQRPTALAVGPQRNKFTRTEDQVLMELVDIFGTDSWNEVAARMGNRSGRQCKDRWMNYLDPRLKACEWTAEEDRLILDLYMEIGTKWVVISRYLQSRTPTAVRNRCRHLLRANRQTSIIGQNTHPGSTHIPTSPEIDEPERTDNSQPFVKRIPPCSLLPFGVSPFHV